MSFSKTLSIVAALGSIFSVGLASWKISEEIKQEHTAPLAPLEQKIKELEQKLEDPKQQPITPIPVPITLPPAQTQVTPVTPAPPVTPPPPIPPENS